MDKEAASLARRDPGATKEVTPEQLAAAERIQRLAPGPAALAAARLQMLELAREYERTRASLPPGDDRTRRMEAVATKMRLLGLACAPFVQDLAESPAPGDRLAAVSILEVRPDGAYLRWLSDRLGVEPPFVGYHAALALRTAVRVLGPADKLVLAEALARARANLGPNAPPSDRSRVLDEAERELALVRDRHTGG